MNFGSLRLDIVRGENFRRDGEELFGVVPRTLWESRFPPDGENRVLLAANGLLVRGQGFALLVAGGPENAEIEAGLGFARSLSGIGVRADEVDALVYPRPRGAGAGRSFPNALIGRVSAGETEVRPGVRLIPLPGHEAGARAVRIDSRGLTAFYFGDALPTAAHLPLPWIPARDAYPAELIRSKQRLLNGAAREGWLCIFENDPDVPWGTIVDGVDGKRRVHPVATGAPDYRPWPTSPSRS